ncbi:uncharacterized protein LOC132122995 [Carassius carassius]|uniref:uncharacterized protein LOC132122995 n=1 Tax=Carassius carassius TaxID=217509 RepID=UPI002868B7B2|nr:uncharacterized protein LOC132122995 [Carassius carassius]
MVNSCVCFGCNNSNLSGHRVHRFPNKKHKDFRAWIRFVQAKRSNFAASSLTRHTVVCEKHFTPDSYNQGDLMEFRMGFRRKEWVRLANGAVPSVHASPPAKSGGSEESNVNVSTSRESARRKRELCTACGTCGYERYWQNQEKVHRNMPACNLLLSGAIHFSGCMATQTIRMLKLFGLQCISPGTFFRHQRYYTIPTIVQAWRNEQSGIIRELKETGGGLILSGDCRSDSPGHCAKYGSYSLIEDRINKVLDVQLVQSSEVPSSSWCELEGLKRSMQFLMDQDMQVSALITDRNRQVAKWVREKMCSEGTKHFFDVWHIGKSVQKALDAAAKERDCEDLKLWRPAIINHLYWTAASTPTGDPDEMQAKWQTLHFNSNGNRDVARTSEGEVRYAVRYPRFRKGGWVVHPIKEKPSYGYATNLMVSLVEEYCKSPQALQESSAVLSSAAPPPLTSSVQKVAKDEAVSLHLARHSRFNM